MTHPLPQDRPTKDEHNVNTISFHQRLQGPNAGVISSQHDKAIIRCTDPTTAGLAQAHIVAGVQDARHGA